MSVPCICDYKDDKGSGPDFIVFIIKYFMMLIVGKSVILVILLSIQALVHMLDV